MKVLRDKPEIPSLAKYQSSSRGHKKVEEAGGESATKRQRAYRSPEAVAEANDKWDWLYKVGVQKMMHQKKAGREQD